MPAACLIYGFYLCSYFCRQCRSGPEVVHVFNEPVRVRCVTGEDDVKIKSVALIFTAAAVAAAAAAALGLLALAAAANMFLLVHGHMCFGVMVNMDEKVAVLLLHGRHMNMLLLVYGHMYLDVVVIMDMVMAATRSRRVSCAGS